MKSDIEIDSIYQIGRDKEFIEHVELRASEIGDEIFHSVVSQIADLTIGIEEAKQLWEQFLHHQETFKNNQLNVSFFTIASDYLIQHTDYFLKPKLLESELHDSLIHDSTTDPLTGMSNKRAFMESLKQQHSLAVRKKSVLSIMFIDLDDFKSINDTNGHLAGDFVLKEFSKIIIKEKRVSDIAARFGGEEFVLIMPETGSKDALVLGERIRKAIQSHEFSYNSYSIRTTVSGGIATYPIHSESIDQLIYYADSAVYRAKGAGKNCIALFKDENRRFLRLPFEAELQVKILDVGLTIPDSGELKNIGFGGILFHSQKEIAIGTPIQINVLLEENPLILIGNVVRVELVSADKYDIGVSIAFHEMEVSAKHRISALLSDKRSSLNLF